VRFKFIEEHQFAFSIGRMCHVMDVSTRGLRRTKPVLQATGSGLIRLRWLISTNSRVSVWAVMVAHE
jgi:hypothetical protein